VRRQFRTRDSAFFLSFTGGTARAVGGAGLFHAHPTGNDTSFFPLLGWSEDGVSGVKDKTITH
jgi:hypothetical protein